MKQKLIFRYYALRKATSTAPLGDDFLAGVAEMKRIVDILWEHYQYDIALTHNQI